MDTSVIVSKRKAANTCLKLDIFSSRHGGLQVKYLCINLDQVPLI